jgi:hypothetical protein
VLFLSLEFCVTLTKSKQTSELDQSFSTEETLEQIRTSTKPARAQKLWCGLYIHEAVILVPRVEYLQITGIVTYIKRSAYQENEGVRLRGRFVEYFPRLSCITGITAYTSIP